MKRLGAGMNRIFPIIIAIIVIAGIVDSAYLAFRDYAKPTAVASSSCFFSDAECDVANKSEDLLMFGLPTGLMGAVYFAVLLGAVLVRLLSGRWLLPWLMFGGFLLGLAYSGYLVHNMVFVMQAVCPYCLAAHSFNVTAFVLFLASWRADIVGGRVASA